MLKTIPNQSAILRETKQLIYNAKQLPDFPVSGTFARNKLIINFPSIANLSIFSRILTVSVNIKPTYLFKKQCD